VNLRDTTRDILSQVEHLTGFPVEVIEDRSLPTTAVVHMASRRTVPAHIVRTNPAAGQPPDYLICAQCGFILRLFANPPEERVECGLAPAAYEEVRKLVEAHLGRQGADPATINRAAERFLNATVVHLRSIPVGLRVSEWLAREYPELLPLQRAQVLNELKLNSETFSPQAVASMPPLILDAILSINATFAMFWSQRLKKPSIVQPYVQAGYRPKAGELLDIYHQTPADPAHDRILVDGWAEALSLSGLYQWIPYQSPA
jgi:hypothetical protein